jgi:SAM-dependent methyltransferase
LARLEPGARILEIGPGTGQATVALARRGYTVIALELGAGLAAVARRKLASFAGVEVVTAAFEDWEPPSEPFDALFAATAFHWLDRGIALERAARALATGGALAVVTTWHVAGGDEAFFVAVQDCYERFMPGTPPGLRLSPADEVASERAAVEAGGVFRRAVARRYERELEYTTAEYLDLLCTYSNHRALEAEARARLLDCIAHLVNERCGGRIAKRYLNELVVAYRA